MSGPARIPLPSGGGALRAVGDSFVADAHTGSGSFAVPLAVPPGRDGVAPDLGLTYSTGNGNGPYGLGWSGPGTSIRRQTSAGLPRYVDDVDTFCLGSGEDLVPVRREGSDVYYQPRTEGMFAEIVHRRTASDDIWILRSRDGLTSTYGTPDAVGTDPAVIADPTRRTSVFAWMLTATLDPFGNRIGFDYQRDSGVVGPHVFDQLYLREIGYLDVLDGGVSRPLATVRFDYEGVDRPDCFSDHRAGFEIRTRRRCRRIDIETTADATRLVRQYRLRYVDERVASGELGAESTPPNRVSLLSQIVVVGVDGAATEPMPPLEFDYTRFDLGRRDFRPLSGELPARSLATSQLSLVDLFGDGLPDILELSGSASRYWRNLGSGCFAPPRSMTEVPAGLQLGGPGVQIVDADGDGRPDLLVHTAELSGYFPLRHTGSWDRASFRRYRRAPSFALNDPEVHLVDLDGDGATDAVRSGSSFEYFSNDRHLGWTTASYAKRRALSEFPDVSFADPRVHWADMGGDGLDDIVYVHRGVVTYWPNQGRGRWGRRVQMTAAPDFPARVEPHRVLLGDVDGDGLSDLIYVDHERVLVWINQCGNGWSPRLEITGTPAVAAGDDIRLVDLLGSGTAGVLWTRDRRSVPEDFGYFLDLTGNRKPYLLAAVDNHLGAITTIAYRSSTSYFVEDQTDRSTRWRTTLPFPVPVVSGVEVVDAISGGKLTTQYRYRHGHFDGADREFRGFARVEQTDTQTFSDYHADADPVVAPVSVQDFAPPTRTVTWFHQGPVGEEFGDWRELDLRDEYWPGDPPLLEHAEGVENFLRSYPVSVDSRRTKRDALRALRGSILRSESYVLDGTPRAGRPYEVSETAYGLREESAPPPEVTQRRVFFPHQVAARVTVWDRGDDPLTTFTFSSEHDAYGQPCRTSEIAPPRRSARRRAVTAAAVGIVEVDPIEVLAVCHRTRYAVPEVGVHLRDRVAEEWTYELAAPRTVPESAPDDVLAVLRDQAEVARDVAAAFAADLPGTARLLDHVLSCYDGPAFEGLPVGAAGRFGALTRVSALVVSDAELDTALGARRPGYLDGPAPPIPGAPPGFGLDLGFRRVVGADGVRRYYTDEERSRHDFQTSGAAARGSVLATRDARGGETTIEYDAYGLLPVRVVNPIGLETRAFYDYRVLQVSSLTDENGNVTEYGYSPLGGLSRTWVRGNPARIEGDRASPSAVVTSDYFAFVRDGTPTTVRTVHRVHHDTDTTVPPAQRDALVESRDYCDGFGRVVQTRTLAEDVCFGAEGDDVGLGPSPGSATSAAVGLSLPTRVIVSGWTVFDNLGQPVRTHEPFFGSGWVYQPRAVHGVATTVRYDGRGRAVRTVRPDGAETRTIFGVPHDLAVPDEFAPTPWEAYGYDPNDLATLSFGPTGDSLGAAAPGSHHATPCSAVSDAGGRVVCRIVRNGTDPSTDWQLTRAWFDTVDNLTALVDPLGRRVLSVDYDLAGNALRVDSLDAGERLTVRNADGEPVEYHDAAGRAELHAYDVAGRATKMWARDDAAAGVTLREHTVYGDEGDAPTNRALNRLGQPARQYDEAGVIDIERYDFAGNPLVVTRRLVDDAVIDGGWVTDWAVADAESRLDGRLYTTEQRVDALDRVVETSYPADQFGHRATEIRRFNRAGLLERVEIDGAAFVDRIAYNARGQQILIVRGNRVMTRYSYDPLTFRLRRLHSQRSLPAVAATYSPTAEVLQDVSYHYDLMGNLVTMSERGPGCGVAGTALGPDALDRTFSRDALYRLTGATGRECGAAPPNPIGNTQPRSADVTLARPYEEAYAYDLAGNLTKLRHTRIAADGARLTDITSYPVGNATNRLTSLDLAGGSFPYSYDACGHLVGETTSRTLAWDHAGQLTGFTVRAGAGPASVVARYRYDASGSRAKKVVRKAGGLESTTYLGGIFERRLIGGQEQCLLHVLDDDRRVASIRVGAAFPGDGAADLPVQYQLGDHLDSSQLVIGGATSSEAVVIRREEYTPYGETSFGSFARKRYRYTGKERDEESGLYQIGARYYAPWLGRWTACDPAGLESDTNLYAFCANDPVTLRDDDGHRPKRTSVHVFEPGVRKDGALVKKGRSEHIGATIDLAKPPAGSAGGGGQSNGARGSPKSGGDAGGGDASKRSAPGGVAGGTPGGTGTDPGPSTPGGSNGGSGGSPVGTSPTGSPQGSPTGSASSNGGSPTGTADTALHKKSSGEGGTGITGKGTGSLTQTDLAVLISNAVADPSGAALDAVGARPEGGKSGGLPEGNAANAAGNPVVQDIYVGVKTLGVVLGGVLSAAKSTAKSAVKNGTKAIAKGSGKAYSVLYRFRLKPKSWPKGTPAGTIRQDHYKRGWQQVGKWIERVRKTDPALAQRIEQEIAGGQWTWHHHARPGRLELVPHSQHTGGGAFHKLFHFLRGKSGRLGAGGFSKWGRDY